MIKTFCDACGVEIEFVEPIGFKPHICSLYFDKMTGKQISVIPQNFEDKSIVKADCRISVYPTTDALCSACVLKGIVRQYALDEGRLSNALWEVARLVGIHKVNDETFQQAMAILEGIVK
jgi:hypothetical protein